MYRVGRDCVYFVYFCMLELLFIVKVYEVLQNLIVFFMSNVSNKLVWRVIVIECLYIIKIR